MFTSITRKSVLAATALAIVSVAGAALAESYPSKPLTFVVPWGAGGRADIVGRMVASTMGSLLNQPIAVVNRTGGRGTVGTKFVLDAPKDGYTILLTTPGSQILGPLNNDVGFQVMDFIGIGRVTASTIVLAANVKQDFADAKQMVALAKASPGKLTFSGVKNVVPWLTVEAFAAAAGIKLKNIPAKGDADAVPMALGGHANMVVSSSTNAVAAHLGAGTMRVLVAFSEKRLPEIPDTPTAVELGYDVISSTWAGLAVAKGVPADVVAKLRATLKQVVNQKTYKNFAKQSKTPLAYTDGPTFEKQWAREHKAYKAVVDKNRKK